MVILKSLVHVKHYFLNSFFGFFGVAQQKMDQEIKERDEKYSELDSKFNRLHKRAKQRIQEVQKVNYLCFLSKNWLILSFFWNL